MASVEELCAGLPLPPEIIDSILTNVSFCTGCQKWTQFRSCCVCPVTICSVCSKTCSYYHQGCRYCTLCAKKRWCPRLKTCLCLQYDEDPDDEITHCCHHNSGNCSQCHEREVCALCDETFCCNHFVVIETCTDAPVHICLEDWVNIQDCINSDLQSREINT